MNIFIKLTLLLSCLYCAISESYLWAQCYVWWLSKWACKTCSLYALWDTAVLANDRQFAAHLACIYNNEVTPWEGCSRRTFIEESGKKNDGNKHRVVRIAGTSAPRPLDSLHFIICWRASIFELFNGNTYCGNKIQQFNFIHHSDKVKPATHQIP